ncbi:MAG: cytochrome c oxidase assembly protein subunit 15 [Planctomycetota bacterium]|jgi:cytochrome c oxidase assembly protein subunit 15
MTVLASIPLIVLGGSVTTLRAGMAEPGWLQPEGHLLWLYPWEKRIASAGVFVEHHHREFGMLVGILCIKTFFAVLFTKRGKCAIWTAFVGLAAVSGQGILGGTRVLDNSPQFAFLHGFIGLAVFGVLVGVAVLLSKPWAELPAPRWAKAPRIGMLSILTLVGLMTQVFFGAWYRHGHGHTAIAIHGLWAIGVVWLGVVLAKRLKRAAQQEGVDPGLIKILRRSAFWMTLFLHLQWVLGGLTLYALFLMSDGMSGENISGGEIVFATMHVTVGAMLIGSVVNVFLWSRRLDTPSALVESSS